VPERYSIHFLNQAKDDLRSIAEFIEERSCDYQVARLWLESVSHVVRQLEMFPNSHPPHNRTPFRKLIHGRYLILFEVNEEEREVLISGILHSARLEKEPGRGGPKHG
jgi:plasmid stabilization system protein ParE